MTKAIRPTRADDLPDLQRVVAETGLFPPDLLPGLFAEASRAAQEVWLTCHAPTPVGFCFAAPEPMAQGTWNMRALCILPQRQRGGLGRALVTTLEAALSAQGARLLLIDTSGTEEFAPARAVDRRLGYGEAARIRDFWADGDDKVVFGKALSP